MGVSTLSWISGIVLVLLLVSFFRTERGRT